MNFKIAPMWWPVFLLLSPMLIPVLLIKYVAFQRNRKRAEENNAKKIDDAPRLELPEVDFVKLSVLVDWKTKVGYLGDAGVSYFIETNLGSLLFDVGHGPENPTLTENAKKLGFHIESAQAVAISHLHKDHMGGLAAARNKVVVIPEELWRPSYQTRGTSSEKTKKTCYLPARASCRHMDAELVASPRILSGGIASTGPLARGLFFFGYTEEQALVIRVKGHGLVVITGCGHPTIETILSMVRNMSNERIYAIIGGLHFPMRAGRGDTGGIQLQRVIGTGKLPWENITDDDLKRTAQTINRTNPEHVLLSGHDTDDYALEMFAKGIRAKFETLRAGEVYTL